MQKFITALRSQAEEYARLHNLKIYDITFRSERGGRVLRISLDGEVTLEVCAAVSRLVSEWLDKNENLIPYSPYTLEVSSLGVNRPLRSMADFQAHEGKLCQITTKTKDKSGRRRYQGRIQSVSSAGVTVYIDEESAQFVIGWDNIDKAQLEIDFKDNGAK